MILRPKVLLYYRELVFAFKLNFQIQPALRKKIQKIVSPRMSTVAIIGYEIVFR